MAFIKFGKEKKLGIREIDNQHKEIYKIVNKLYDIKSNSKKEILISYKILLKQLQNHFIYEENFMEENKDIHLFSHKLEHQRALTKYTNYFVAYKSGKKKFDVEILISIKTWIENHFEFKDSKLKLIETNN